MAALFGPGMAGHYKFMKKTLAATLMYLFCAVSHADVLAPRHYCSEPYRPFIFENKEQINQYFDDVEAYGDCVFDFIDEQEKQIKKHQQSIIDAQEQLEQFKNRNLKELR